MEFLNDISGDPLKPSLFELVAQEQLRDLLQPAVKYVLSVFAQSYPRYLLRIVNRHEEFYALIMLFIERHHLWTHNASFAENFYGLKRRRKPLIEMPRARIATGMAPPEEKLRTRDLNRSLFWLVGLPYIRAKAQDYFEELGGGIDSDILDTNDSARLSRVLGEESLRARLRRSYKRVYPWLNLSFELWLLTYNIAYLFDRTSFYRPWLSWIGVDLRRLGVEDMRPPTAQLRAPLPKRSILQMLRIMLISSPRLLLDSMKVILPTVLFFIKFLEWWYSPSSPARALATAPQAPMAPPPRMLPPHPDGLQVDRQAYGICPLCQKSFANPTALASGYVFCYRCAYSQVEEHGTCPVTLLPANIWQLRKVLL